MAFPSRRCSGQGNLHIKGQSATDFTDVTDRHGSNPCESVKSVADCAPPVAVPCLFATVKLERSSIFLNGLLLWPNRLMNEKARGEGFFAEWETLPYLPLGDLRGQFHDDSCLAACCRMLLADSVEDVAEARLRVALEMEGGAYLSAAPATMREFGLPGYVYNAALLFPELGTALMKGPAIVAVKHHPDDVDVHAVVIDRIAEEFVSLRDPLPEGTGSAYQVAVEQFLNVWLRAESGTGRAVVVE